VTTVDPIAATFHRWADIPLETLKGTITRKLVTGDRIMVAQITLKAGDEVPQHAHENEQVSYVVEGALRFFLGADGERVVEVRSGEVLVIPSNLPHRVVALADSFDLDLFNPPRQDWLAGTDAYLRR
jgi:quercetin dioxygenase-like cupin family protein